MRKLIPQILARDSEIEVVGTAMDGSFGLQKIEDLKPDVVTLDLEMPRMDGLAATPCRSTARSRADGSISTRWTWA